MKYVHVVSSVLLWVGGLNWDLIGLGGFMGGDWNVVNMLLGSWPAVEWLVYVLVGLAAVYELVTHRSSCRVCGSGSSM